jgi:hypothetical protein
MEHRQPDGSTVLRRLTDKRGGENRQYTADHQLQKSLRTAGIQGG